jgi:predicted RNA-binding protein with PIN domain
MRIIIDGYNLIRQSSFRQYERTSLEAGRNALLRSLVAYQKNRGHRVTVVFDGWQGGSPHEERDRAGEVEIIYSRIGEKADEVIKRLAANSGDEIAVVTSDREIATYASRRGRNVVSSAAFITVLEATSRSQKAAEAADSSAMNALFGDSGDCRRGWQPDEDDPDDGDGGKTKKKGPSHRLSRQKRAVLAAIRKL